MQITTTEPVIRTYCDVCGIHITGNHRTGEDIGGTKYATCMETNYTVGSYNNSQPKCDLTCMDVWDMWKTYPMLKPINHRETIANELKK